MIFIIMGAPGAGKGTQTELLANEKKFDRFSTGDALRLHVKNETEIGKSAKELMDSGRLLPDELLFSMVEERCVSVGDAPLILDGFPRTLNQAKLLQSIRDKKAVKGVVYIKVEKENLINRLGGRRVCDSCQASYHVTNNPSQTSGVCDKCGGKLVTRPDDQPDNIATRFEIFEKQVGPIIGYYDTLGLAHYVDGGKPVMDVYSDLKSKVEELV